MNESLTVARSRGGGGGLAARVTAIARDNWASVAAGLLAAAVLVGLYVGLVTWAESIEHALQLLGDEWYFVGPIAGGFGLQVGLFVRVRQLVRRRAAATTALTASGTGASTAAMLACCAHHVADVLPLLGLSGAAVFLSDYRFPLMAAGLAVNALGVVVMVRLTVMHTRQARTEARAC